ncbi:hypothetical protein ABU162_02705 [Paenibacillus thiaminolyticus]|uniref:hypothetical protein n=1 Tax=Paenibacillus thiaminolyticus TaxID=49283 RepID=UPI0035A74031
MLSRLMMCLIVVAAMSGIVCNEPVQAQPSRLTQENIDKFVQKYFSEENLQKHHITSAAFTFVEGDHIMYN